MIFSLDIACIFDKFCKHADPDCVRAGLLDGTLSLPAIKLGEFHARAHITDCSTDKGAHMYPKGGRNDFEFGRPQPQCMFV